MCSEPARMPAKYYIYAGGRWCEVDTRRGRVSGWRQRARFCFLRGGRLEVARTSRVLRALRGLATGVGGAARDAAPLLRQRPHRPCRERARAHHCCSQHHHHSRCDLNANDLSQNPPPSLPTSTPITASPRKRKRSASQDSVAQAKQQKSSETGRKTSKQDQEKSKAGINRKEKDTQRVLDSSKKKPQIKTAKIRSKDEEELVQSLLQSSSDEEGRAKSEGREEGGVRSKKQSQNSLLADGKGKKSPQKVRARGKEEEKIVQSLLQSSSEDERSPRAPRSKPKDSDSSSDSSVDSRKEMQCKELVIDDGDVAVLRRFLERGADGTDLERFDKDEEYKTSVFYKLNPLVVLKRCRPLEQLLLQRLSIKEFARHLGLRSVADVTPEKRYRMRHSTRQARRVTSDSETDKENVAKPKRRLLWNRDKELFNSRSSRSSDVRERPQIPRPARDGSRDNSDTEVKRNIKRHLERQAARANPVSESKETAKKANDDSVMITDSSESDDSKKINNDSVVVSDETDSDKDKGKSRRNRAKNDEVIVSDESSSVKRNRRKSAAKDENESVVVSDGNSTDEEKRNRKTVAKDDDDSVVLSDDSDSDDSNDDSKSVRRTRSQGPEKRELRERNKSVISNTNTNTDKNEVKKNFDKVENRSRSRGPDRTLKEQNRSVNNDIESIKVDTKKTDIKKKHVERSTENRTNRTTRSSMKGNDEDKNKIESNVKASNKAEAANRKEGSAKKEVKSKIAEVAPIVREDKSVTSDNDNFTDNKLSKSSKFDQAVGKARTDKGRFAKTKNKKTRSNEKQNTENLAEKSKNNEREKERDENRDTAKNKTGNEKRNEKSSAVIRNMFGKPIKAKKSSVANGREYTSLEDHAIVAWVSLGNRERLVNGNAIWRELQSEYPRLTSQTRSWHSLRNRYLRYILPSLGSLALPPAQVSRLRAAAAIGTIKNRGEKRRNSIFRASPVRSAAVAGRGRMRIGSDEDDKRERTPPPRRPSHPSPSKRVQSPSKQIPSPSKRVPSPSKQIPSPSKMPPSPAKTFRLRSRPSASSTPTPQKKKRIH